MVTNPPQPRDHVESLLAPGVTIEYLQQEDVMKEAETVVRVEEGEFNRNRRDTKEVTSSYNTHHQGNSSKGTASSPALGSK